MAILEDLPEGVPHRSGGIELHVRRMGAGPRLLLLHGGPGLDHHVLLPLAVPLSRRFEVLLPDLPGHGRSHSDAVGLPDLTTVQERTARWIEELTPTASVVAGHSLGAWLVREMLALGRLRPSAAVLISSPVQSTDGAGNRLDRSGIGPRRSRDRGREGRLAREFLDLCAEGTDDAPSPSLVEAVSRSRLRASKRYDSLLGQFWRAMTSPLKTIDPGCPVLVLTGEADHACLPEEAARLCAATTGARLRVLPGAGHVPYSADAEPVARAIVEFVDSCRPQMRPSVPDRD